MTDCEEPSPRIEASDGGTPDRRQGADPAIGEGLLDEEMGRVRR